VRGPEPSHRTDWFKNLIDVATLFMIDLGLYFAFVQARKVAAPINSATWNTVASQELNLDNILINNPEARKYFYRGAHLVSVREQVESLESVSRSPLKLLNHL
jgi:hypothetical protein